MRNNNIIITIIMITIMIIIIIKTSHRFRRVKLVKYTFPVEV